MRTCRVIAQTVTYTNAMLDIPQQNPLKYGFSEIEIYIHNQKVYMHKVVVQIKSKIIGYTNKICMATYFAYKRFSTLVKLFPKHMHYI